MSTTYIKGRMLENAELKKAGTYDILKFTVVESSKKKDGTYLNTPHECQAWGDLALQNKDLKKGDTVIVIAKFEVREREWQGKKIVDKGFKVDNIGLVARGAQASSYAPPPPPPPPPTPPPEMAHVDECEDVGTADGPF